MCMCRRVYVFVCMYICLYVSLCVLQAVALCAPLIPGCSFLKRCMLQSTFPGPNPEPASHRCSLMLCTVYRLLWILLPAWVEELLMLFINPYNVSHNPVMSWNWVETMVLFS